MELLNKCHVLWYLAAYIRNRIGNNPGSKVLSALDGPHVGPMNIAIWPYVVIDA